MDGRSDFVGVLVLGCVALGALALMGALALTGQQIPASVGAAFGTSVGALAMAVHSRKE